MKLSLTIEQVNDVLPQTQCGLCSYAGCKPYATAIVEQGEAINRCPPGGVTGLIKLGKLTGVDPAPFIVDMQAKEKPKMIAVIREAECIGCTKCIQACPVDAILGSGKLMHTVITDECTGCELCVTPCPVDCIDIVATIESNPLSDKELKQQAQHYRQRYEFRLQRLEQEKNSTRSAYLKNKQTAAAQNNLSKMDKQKFIAEALARVQQKKQNETR